MRKALALIRASWLSALSYRLQMAFSIIGLLVGIVPLYFVTGALQTTMARSIQNEGDQYFAFLIVGMITYSFIATSVNSLHGALGSAISSGTLEAVLGTPTPLGWLLMGMIGYDFIWTSVRALIILLSAWWLGAHVVWSSGLLSLGILLLVMLAYLPLGVLAASMVLAFRTTGPFPGVILTLSALLGGVYYPTRVIPSWLEQISVCIPLTYGLRALRRCLLEGASLSAVATDVAILGGFIAVLFGASLWVFSWALRYAKRAGTLAQY